MKKGFKEKGFTLIEIIVVVVILAILAALILPRFLAQPERAAIAEAQQMLGAIRRAQKGFIDLGGTTTTAVGATAGVGNLGGDAGWKSLGLGQLGATTRFNYVCTAGNAVFAAAAANAGSGGDQTALNARPVAGAAGTCSATRTINIGAAGNDIITISTRRGSFSCGTVAGGSAYQPVTASIFNGCSI